MASGKTQDAPQLSAPSIGDITSQAVNANISNLPAILDAYKKYGPEAAASMLQAAQSLNPTLKPLGDLLTGRINQVASGGIPDTLKTAYETQFRNANASRGFLDSPASANAEAIGLAGLGEEFAQNTIGDSIDYGKLLTSTGGTPTLANLGLDLPGVGTQENNALDATKNANDVALSQYQIEQANKKRQSQQLGGLVGGGVGAAIGLAGGPIGAAQGYQAGTTIGGTFF